MKIILTINNNLFCVTALTKKNAEKKAKQIIEKIIFDPTGYAFKATLVKGKKITKTEIKISDPFSGSELFSVWPE